MNNKGHIISNVINGSVASKYDICIGDEIISINDTVIDDIFDYRYLIQDSKIKLLLKDGKTKELKTLNIKKPYFDDLGIDFEMPLLDAYRRCSNNCIFCFIDQLPKGMRETLYFKDDDSRLSFLQGNYMTLTNMKDKDFDKIIKYHLSPINISIHTMNKELRCKMLHNRFAGDSLSRLDQLYEAGISMNAQIVLCPGINDGAELDYSISELVKYVPTMMSMSVVPIGLTKFRDGLYPMRNFTPEECSKTIDIIEKWQKIIYEKHQIHFVHASDEFYLTAKRPLPEEDRYDGYLQIDNGVGMLRSMTEEVKAAIKEITYSLQSKGVGKLLLPGLRGIIKPKVKARELSIATGLAAYAHIKKYSEWIMHFFPQVKIHVYGIKNDFFGPKITVTGLLTYTDLVAQLSSVELGSELQLSENMFRSGEEVFLDDHTRTELENALQVRVLIVKSSGFDFVSGVLGLDNGCLSAEHNPYEL